jgi:hypothetical protein
MPVTAAAANNDTPVDDGAPVDAAMEAPVDAAAMETTSSAAVETATAAAPPRHGVGWKSKSRRQSGNANNFAHHGDILPFKTEENDRMKCLSIPASASHNDDEDRHQGEAWQKCPPPAKAAQ